MKLIGSWSARLALVFAVAVALITILQARATENRRFSNPVHSSVDWSNRHMRYSGAGTAAQSWKLYADPRFQRHMLMLGRRGRFGRETWRGSWHIPRHPFFRNRLKRDWQMPLDANATTGDWQHNGGYYASPAKFTFDINATPSCTADYVTFPTNLPGATGTTASIVGLNQLYSGPGGLCGTGQPSVDWAYNTNLSGDTTGKVMSSPVLSLDGTRIVYVETAAAGGALLKILQWKSLDGTIGVSVPPANLLTTGSAWSTCPAGTSCLFTLSFSGGAQDTGSSPFVDYLNDALYVGDDAGSLHKFTGVFNGTPTEETTGWPIAVSTGKLTSPVFDEVSGNIYVADNITPSASSLFYVRDTASTVGTCAVGTPPCKGGTSLTVTDLTLGVFDPPIVDPVKQTVYVFVGKDTNGFAAVYQTTTAIGSTVNTELGEPPTVPFAGDVTAPGYGGAFDSNYVAGNYASSFLYVCGTTPTTLYRIGFNSSGVMNSAVDPGSFRIQQAVPAKPAANCSPFSEILNGTNDFIFFGIPYDVPLLLNGTVVALNLSTMSGWPPVLADFADLPEVFGPSGIVVDNVGAGGQESSIYFTPQSGTVTCNSVPNVGCAVKATQAGLN
jgi:hypothetical protein